MTTVKTYPKGTGSKKIRTEIVYTPQLTKEELLVLAKALDTASFSFQAGSGLLLDKLVAMYPNELADFER